MNVTTLEFTANEQELIKTDGLDEFASNTVAYIEAHFALGDNWNGFDAVRAVWSSYYGEISTVLDASYKCKVPTEILLHRSKVYVNLVGSIAEDDVLTDRLTSFPIKALTVTADARVETTETAPITPSQFEQFVETVHEDAQAIINTTQDSEAWAVGTRGGVPVSSDDPAYENNSKYYATQVTPDTTLSIAGRPADAKAVGDALAGGTGQGLTEDVKQALLQIASKVAYIDEDGQDYYDALYGALYPPADLVSITATYTQSGAVYDTASLDDLKTDLVVMANYSDSTSEVVTNYTLSGTLTVGTSTITVIYGGKTDTFTVTVSSTAPLYPFENGTHTFSNGSSVTVTNGNEVTITQGTGNSNDTQANASKVSDNTTSANNSDGNYKFPTAFFSVTAGSTVETEVEILQATSSNANNQCNVALRAVTTGARLIDAIANSKITSHTVGEVLTTTTVAEENMDIGCVGIWNGHASSSTTSFSVRIKIWVDGIRYV